MNLKRYFVCNINPAATLRAHRVRSVWHALDLPAGGWIIVMMDGSGVPPPEWRELPHLLEHAAAGFNGTHATLGEAPKPGKKPRGGCLATDTTYQVARKMAAEHSEFRP